MMMKNYTFILLVCLLAGCYRPGNPPEYNVPPAYKIMMNGNSTFFYSAGSLLDSVTTFTVNDSDSLSITFRSSLISGNPEKYPITISFPALPHGITAAPASFTFRLDYTLTVKLSIRTGTAADYLVNISVSDSANGNRTYPVRLHVIAPHPAPDCSSCLIRNWTSITHCTTTDTCHPIITAISGMPHWVRIQNINCLGDSVVVNAYVSCYDGITIPMQTSKGYTIYGHLNSYPCGTYVAYTIPDTVVHNGDTTACGFALRNF